MKFYKRDPNAAIAGMAALTLQERGAYNSIIDILYSRDGDLPDDDEMLRSMLGCHGNEWRCVKAKLIAKGKIWIEDGKLKAKRVDSVLAEAEEFAEIQRKRAGKRWETGDKPPTNRREIADKSSGNTPETSDKQPTNARKGQEKQQSADAIAGNANTPTPTPTPTAIEEEKGSLRSPKEREPELAFHAWNTLAEETGLPRAQALSKLRRSKLCQRLHECGGLDGFKVALEKVRASAFLNGSGERGWKADLDFVLQQGSFAKIMEGSFDDRKAHGTSSHAERLKRAAEIFDERRREAESRADSSGQDNSLFRRLTKGPS